MKVSKGIVAVIVAAGLSMGMVACSSDEATVHETAHDVSKSGKKSTTDNDNDPDLPEKVTGMRDDARKVYEEYSIPDEYIQLMLDEEIEVAKDYIDSDNGEMFYLSSKDLSILISVDGEIADMSVDSASVYKGYFEPWTVNEK